MKRHPGDAAVPFASGTLPAQSLPLPSRTMLRGGVGVTARSRPACGMMMSPPPHDHGVSSTSERSPELETKTKRGVTDVVHGDDVEDRGAIRREGRRSP